MTSQKLNNKHRYTNVLSAFGLAEAFGKLKPRHQRQLLSLSFPAVEIYPSPDVPKDICHTVNKQFLHETSTRIACPHLAKAISVQDYMTIALSFAHAGSLFTTGNRRDEKPYEFTQEAKKRILPTEIMSYYIIELLKAGDFAVSELCFIDKAIYGLAYQESRKKAAPHRYFILHKKEQKSTKFKLPEEDESRNYFICSSHEIKRTDTGISDVYWTKEHFHEIPDELKLPVYIQTHALAQLEKRLMAEEIFYRYALHDFLWSSMDNPSIIEYKSSYYVEYMVNGFKLGYIPIIPYPRGILAKTFLFLTMDGTPEGDKLYQKLHINRRDKHHLAWDSLKTFTISDLREDEWIRNIFKECDCDHLFDFAKKYKYAIQKRGYKEIAHHFFSVD